MFNSLEPRRLLAAQFVVSNGVLNVIGSDAYRDHVTIEYVNAMSEEAGFSDDVRITVAQRTAGGTLVSSVSREVHVSDYVGFRIDTKGENDTVIVGNEYNLDEGTRFVTVLGGAGNDRVTVTGETLQLIDGGSGNDTLDGAATLRGGSGNDVLMGDTTGESEVTGQDETFFGDAGLDTIRGNGGNDTIDGGVSDDLIEQAVDYPGRTSGTRINGGDGNDHIDVIGAFDEIRGGRGNDTVVVHSFFEASPGGEFDQDNLYNSGDVYGEADSDTIRLQSLFLRPGEFLRVFGGAHNDTIFGSDKGDYLEGNESNDSIFGNDGNDSLYGGSGADRLVGGFGYDQLFSAGDNTRDTLDGGADGIADRFVKDTLDVIVG